MIRLNKERHKILTNNPHIQSYASNILLRYKYKLSLRRLPYANRIWLTFRNKYLRQQKKLHGKLSCAYCGFYPLEANFNNPHSALPRATIDHIYPLSRGGKRYDENNLCVACVRCNQKKADKI